MDKITNDVREEGVKELLYADEFVLLRKTYHGKRFQSECKKQRLFCTGK